MTYGELGGEIRFVLPTFRLLSLSSRLPQALQLSQWCYLALWLESNSRRIAIDSSIASKELHRNLSYQKMSSGPKRKTGPKKGAGAKAKQQQEDKNDEPFSLARDPALGMAPRAILTGYYGSRGERLKHTVHNGALTMPQVALDLIEKTEKETGLKGPSTYQLPGLDYVVRPCIDRALDEIVVTELSFQKTPMITQTTTGTGENQQTQQTLKYVDGCKADNKIRRHKIRPTTTFQNDNNGAERIRGGGGDVASGDDSKMDVDPPPPPPAATASEETSKPVEEMSNNNQSSEGGNGRQDKSNEPTPMDTTESKPAAEEQPLANNSSNSKLSGGNQQEEKKPEPTPPPPLAPAVASTTAAAVSQPPPSAAETTSISIQSKSDESAPPPASGNVKIEAATPAPASKNEQQSQQTILQPTSTPTPTAAAAKNAPSAEPATTAMVATTTTLATTPPVAATTAPETATSGTTPAVSTSVPQSSASVLAAAASSTTANTPTVEDVSKKPDPVPPAKGLNTKPPSHWVQHKPGPNDEMVTPQDQLTPRPGWYKSDCVADIERTMLPEWFNSTASHRTPKSYMEAREKIISISDTLANRNVTNSMVRRYIVGDSGSLHRLRQFLVNFGLINEDGINDSSPTHQFLRDKKPGPPKSFDDTLKEELLGAVVEQGRKRKYDQLNTSSENTFIPINWEEVAAQVGRGVTSEQCEQNFLSLEIDDMAASSSAAERSITPDIPAVAAVAKSSDAEEGKPNESQHTVRKELIRTLVETTNPDVMEKVLKTSFEATGGDLKKAQSAALLGLSAAGAVGEARKEEAELSSVLSQLVHQRMRKLENRMALLDDVEGIMEAERIALELERRDLYTARCRHWFGGA